MAKIVNGKSANEPLSMPEELMIAELDDRQEFSLGVIADSIVTLNGGCNGNGCSQNVFCK